MPSLMRSYHQSGWMCDSAPQMATQSRLDSVGHDAGAAAALQQHALAVMLPFFCFLSLLEQTSLPCNTQNCRWISGASIMSASS